MDIETIRGAVLGAWCSVAPEVRPSSTRSADGAIQPFYLTRSFTALPDDRFELDIVSLADPLGKVPLARMSIRGHMRWRGPHPIAAGAQKVDFVADEAFEVTPLAKPFADLLNRVAAQDYSTWTVDQAQSVFEKEFLPFGLVAGRHFQEYDLAHIDGDLLYWGARHVDGRGFDTEANRPTNLQVPMRRRAID